MCRDLRRGLASAAEFCMKQRIGAERSVKRAFFCFEAQGRSDLGNHLGKTHPARKINMSMSRKRGLCAQPFRSLQEGDLT